METMNDILNKVLYLWKTYVSSNIDKVPIEYLPSVIEPVKRLFYQKKTDFLMIKYP